MLLHFKSNKFKTVTSDDSNSFSIPTITQSYDWIPFFAKATLLVVSITIPSTVSNSDKYKFKRLSSISNTVTDWRFVLKFQ